MATALFSSSLSTLADSQAALEEASNALREGLGGEDPDLVLAFVSMEHGSEFRSFARRIRAQTGARTLLGCTGQSVVGPDSEVEDGPAIALWAVSCPELRIQPFRISASQEEGGEIRFSTLPPIEDAERSTLLLFADPFTFPMPEYLRLLNERAPGVPAIGGMASGGRGPNQNFLFLDDTDETVGAIGAVLEGGIELHPIVSQGCRPIGTPLVITRVQSNLIHKFGGRQAARVLAEVVQELSPDDRELFQNGPFLGIAVDASKSEFRRGDFLVRGIMGIHRQENAVAVADNALRAGQTVQFMVRDAVSAGEDLSQLLREGASFEVADPSAAGALLFTCNGRGTAMFGETLHHDITRVQENFNAAIPAAGFFAMGEIGPVGGRNFLHGFTASVAVFRARPED